MISLNTLSAFTQEVARNRAAQGSTAVQGTQGTSPIQQVQAGSARDIQPAQRTLEAVPAMPTKSLPRGSLLDLRV
ncbi:hypothetical protein EOD42_00780 [Rhodovarius crocodyli]|uniref:Uncharacterized protein n=1 Tax=Rhodovarius crocodyli TaxID=1979269 RepID=A0A437MM00_9PROT|nr:hypothetical protein [Rhodovarius crocodyli]RVT98680.1 hypothetical protein EOD42_00780 [Rhodovarius crocodyli]